MKFPWCVGPRKALSWPCVEQTLVDLDLNRRRPFLSPPATHRNWILCSLLNVERRCSWEVWAEVLRCCGNRRQWQTCSTFPCISGELHLPLSELCLFLQAPSLSNKVSSWLFTKYLILIGVHTNPPGWVLIFLLITKEESEGQRRQLIPCVSVGCAGEVGLETSDATCSTVPPLASVKALEGTLSKTYYILACLLKQRMLGVGNVCCGVTFSWWIKVPWWAHVFLFRSVMDLCYQFFLLCLLMSLGLLIAVLVFFLYLEASNQKSSLLQVAVGKPSRSVSWYNPPEGQLCSELKKLLKCS